jgi:hypothetical protein
MPYEVEFSSSLFKYPGSGGWTFATVPEEHAPSVTLAWGRVPVDANVDDTSGRRASGARRTGARCSR